MSVHNLDGKDIEGKVVDFNSGYSLESLGVAFTRISCSVQAVLRTIPFEDVIGVGKKVFWGSKIKQGGRIGHSL